MNAFIEIENMSIKKIIILQNIKYLRGFASKLLKYNKMNDYETLIFTFLESRNS